VTGEKVEWPECVRVSGSFIANVKGDVVQSRAAPVALSADESVGRHSPMGLDRLPPHWFFVVSAVFHYLGPSLAVLLFTRVDVLGVAWLRIASAACVFGVWRRPWRKISRMTARQAVIIVALGAVLAAMNSVFYLAVARLPLASVGVIEFLGTVVLAATGIRTRRNTLALALVVGGVTAVTEARLGGQALGFAFAFANCGLFMLYVILGHHVANPDSDGAKRPGGPPIGAIDQLALSMLVAAAVAIPIGFRQALPALSHPRLLLAGVGVGVCSSVIPYVTDQLAMARLPRATFALMLGLLPAVAAVMGAIVLGQVPTIVELIGIVLVIAGVAIHREEKESTWTT
jgi:inner membrane transporter RhtA